MALQVLNIPKMEHVLETVELLELILSHVDLQSILTSGTRVCRFWNEVIEDSPQLQTLLFFRPDMSPAKNGQGHFQQAPRTNTLLLRHFGSRITNTSFIRAPRTSSAPSDGSRDVVPSWHRMFLQQPSPKKFGIWKVDTGGSFQHGFQNSTETQEFEEQGGLRMGTLTESMNQLGQGSPWTLYWGEEGRKCLARERKSLLVLKARLSERASLFKMWDTSDVVVKFTRWTNEK